MGTYLRVFSESFPMNTNMTGFRSFSKNPCVLALRMKVASALEGLIYTIAITICSMLCAIAGLTVLINWWAKWVVIITNN